MRRITRGFGTTELILDKIARRIGAAVLPDWDSTDGDATQSPVAGQPNELIPTVVAMIKGMVWRGLCPPSTVNCGDPEPAEWDRRMRRVVSIMRRSIYLFGIGYLFQMRANAALIPDGHQLQFYFIVVPMSGYWLLAHGLRKSWNRLLLAPEPKLNPDDRLARLKWWQDFLLASPFSPVWFSWTSFLEVLVLFMLYFGPLHATVQWWFWGVPFQNFEPGSGVVARFITAPIMTVLFAQIRRCHREAAEIIQRKIDALALAAGKGRISA